MKKKLKILILLLGIFLVVIIAVLSLLLFLVTPLKDNHLNKDDFCISVVEISSTDIKKQEIVIIDGPNGHSIANIFLKGLSFTPPNEYEIKLYYIMGLPPYSANQSSCWFFGERAVSPLGMIIGNEKIPEGKAIKITITNSEGAKECIANIRKENGRLFIDEHPTD